MMPFSYLVSGLLQRVDFDFKRLMALPPCALSLLTPALSSFSEEREKLRQRWQEIVRLDSSRLCEFRFAHFFRNGAIAGCRHGADFHAYAIG
jgi:hypothetical protein